MLSMREAALAGLGLLGMTREKAMELVRVLTQEGKLSQEQGSRLLHELVERGEREREALQEFVADTVRRTVNEFGLAVRDDLRALEQRLAALERRWASEERRRSEGWVTDGSQEGRHPADPEIQE